ncbi:MAG: aminopeptidase P family N-terminal domain-containing protein [Paramuribaculum sp.]|nr:aminopeptidase P family N-terminal domain-containing protein [Paramuribaculum sp.]
MKSQPLILLSPQELALRLNHVTDAMRNAGADARLIADNANIYYMTGRIVCGYI